MINRIIELTKVFLKSSFSFSNIQSAKINIRGILKWVIIFILAFIGLLSYKILDLLRDINQYAIFLSILFLLLAFLVIFQTILVCINLFYNSKDMEYILPLPLKPIELLISKFNVLLITIYATELLFVAFPLLIYGVVTQVAIRYYLYIIILLIIFPILPALLGCIVIMLFMRLAKYFKNVSRFQNIITILSTILILVVNFMSVKNTNMQNTVITDEIALQKILEANVISENIGKYFLTIQPSISALTNTNFWISLLDMLKVILITAISYFIFLYLGKSIYLKGILANLNKVKVSKKRKKIKLKDYKKHKLCFTYIKKEIELIIRNPIFFAQCVLPTFYIPILCIFFGFVIYQSISGALGGVFNWDALSLINIDLSIVCIIVGIGQIMNFMSITAVTAFSRDGKQAKIVKYLPVSFYKQFIYKMVPALIFDMIPSIIVTGLAYLILPDLTIEIALITLFISILLNIIRIYLLQILDLTRPKLNWDAEYMVVRQNSNIMISIGLLGIIILLLIYFAKAFSKLSLQNAIITIISILVILFIIINIFVKKKENQLFKKII